MKSVDSEIDVVFVREICKELGAAREALIGEHFAVRVGQIGGAAQIIGGQFYRGRCRLAASQAHSAGGESRRDSSRPFHNM